MRLTYSTMKSMFLDATGNTGSTDTALLNFYKRSLGTKYQMMLSELQVYATQKVITDTTVAAQQYYKNPVDMVQAEQLTVTVGSIAYPLTTVSSQYMWNKINETLISTTTIPQFYFPRRDDYGIWPIPQAAYTLTLSYLYRNRDLTQDDYVTGGLTIVNGSTAVLGVGTTFTANMVGRFLSVTDDGYWYRIASVSDANNLVIDHNYMGVSVTNGNYTIGETPEMPEEAHEILVWGVLADFYGMYKKDSNAQIWWNNMFWTGDGQNSSRTGANIQGGLIGVRNRYAARSNDRVIRKLHINDLKNTYLFTQTISQ